MKSADTQPDAQVCQEIAFVGHALAPCFLIELSAENMADYLNSFASLDAEALRAWPFLDDGEGRACLGVLSRAAQQIGESEIWDYRRLFIGPGELIAPPWGSVYTDFDSVILGLSTVALREWLRDHGVHVQKETPVVEDHIGIMLTLMAWLAENHPELLDEFLCDHLLPWSSHFFEIMEDGADTVFFKSLAKVARLTLEGIERTRQLDAEIPIFYR